MQDRISEEELMAREEDCRKAINTLGSIVQKGKFAACAFALDKQLKRVDLPTFGRPTIPHCKAIYYLFLVFILILFDKCSDFSQDANIFLGIFTQKEFI